MSAQVVNQDKHPDKNVIAFFDYDQSTCHLYYGLS